MNKTKFLLKNMGILTISNFASKILVFLLVPLYTSVLSTREYGTYDLAISTATLFYPILTLNIVDAVMRFSMDKEYNKGQVALIGIKYLLISMGLFGAGMVALHYYQLWPDVYGLEYYVFFYYVFYTLNQFLIQFCKGLERVKELGIAGVISTLVAIATNILFLLVFNFGLCGFFLANIISLLSSVLYLSIRINLFKYLKGCSISRRVSEDMLAYSVPLIATAVGWWVNSTADKYVVSIVLGVAANGILSVAYKIPQIINTLQGIFTQAWQISAIREYGSEDTSVFYGKTFSIINLLMCACCSWLIILTRPLAHVLFAKDFYIAWKYVPFLLVSSVLNCASGLLGPILSAKKNSKAMMWSAIIGAGANVVMNILFVSLIGIQGATIATVICSYIIYFVRYKAVGNDIKMENYGAILLTWILLIFQGFIESYVSNYFVEIVVMIVLLVINGKALKDLLIKSKAFLAAVRK